MQVLTTNEKEAYR